MKNKPDHKYVYIYESVIQYPKNIAPYRCLDRDCVGFTIDTCQPFGHRPIYGKKTDHTVVL